MAGDKPLKFKWDLNGTWLEQGLEFRPKRPLNRVCAKSRVANIEAKAAQQRGRAKTALL